MSLKKIISYKNGLLVYASVLVVINYFLTQLPLTSTFGYEFAASNGLMLCIIAGLYTINSVRKSDFILSELIKYLLILFLIPIIISVINSILTMFCSFIDGLAFYLLIVGVSILFGAALALLINSFTVRFGKLLFFTAIIIFALIPILEIYFNPQVYFYSPLIGFFPGNIYDEGLSADWKLFFHQLLVITFSLLIIYFIQKQKTLNLKSKLLFISAILIIASLFQFLSPYLGYITTFTKLDSVLSKQIESESLILHYDNIDSTEAKLIALTQEFYYAELQNVLKFRPSKKINVYLFNNREQKKLLFGAGNADVAKPWQYSIYISADSWQSTLKHELAHVFTAEFGTGPFKLASGFNAALIEGMAESLDGFSNHISIEEMTSLAYNNGYVLNVKSLFTGLSFFKGNSALAYTYSGAFIQYLTDNFGIEKVKEFYSTGDFESVFETKIEVAQKKFEKNIFSPELSNKKAMADYYFGRLSLIQKVCPRYIGDRLSKAYQYLSERKLDKAEILFKEMNNKTLNYSSLVGLSEIYYQRNKKNVAIQVIFNNYKKFTATAYYNNLIFRLAELYSLNMQNDSAAYYYKKIIEDNPNHQLSYLCNTRLSLLEENKLYEYLDGSDSLKLKILIFLNDKEYNYHSLPIIVDILQKQNIDYKKSLTIFNKTFIVNNIESSFAAFKLSQYMLENSDFVNARKYAALSLRYNEKNLFHTAMQAQFEKASWFLKNSERIMDKFVHSTKQ